MLTAKDLLRSLVRFVLPLIARIEIHGRENLLVRGGFIIAANHLGQLDSALIFFLIERNDLMYLVNDKYKNYCIGHLKSERS
jgi:1-acyl-sn-glycerol-3-phosphate acyltransferase